MAAHYLVQAELAAGGFEHHLLVGRARDQPIDHHFLRLADAVHPAEGLRLAYKFFLASKSGLSCHLSHSVWGS